MQLQFLINEGALISATTDDTLHLWNFRQKIPQVVQSLKFQRDRSVLFLCLFVLYSSIPLLPLFYNLFIIESFTFSLRNRAWSDVIEWHRTSRDNLILRNSFIICLKKQDNLHPSAASEQMALRRYRTWQYSRTPHRNVRSIRIRN